MLVWVVTPYRLVRRYQGLRETYCLHLQGLSALKMETICSSKILVSTYKSTRRDPEDKHRHLHNRENLKSHVTHTLSQSSDVSSISHVFGRYGFRSWSRHRMSWLFLTTCDANIWRWYSVVEQHMKQPTNQNRWMKLMKRFQEDTAGM
jgi:hypothetical protein